MTHDDLCVLNLDRKYKIIRIQGIGNDLSCIVIEDRKTNQLRFMKVYYQPADKNEKQNIKLT